MARRTLTELELNRALLARQHLLARTSTPLPRLLEDISGIQAQYAPSMYLGVWTRLERFDRQDLTAALERDSVVQATLMRATIHLVSRRDYWPIVEAVAEPLREWWIRTTKRTNDSEMIAGLARHLRDVLGGGPQRRAALMEQLGIDGSTWNGLNVWLPMLRVPPSGTWERRRADLYAAAEFRIGPSTSTVEMGRELLVRRYLRGFGPASRADISSFTGLPMPTVPPVLERLRLRTFRSEDGTELLDVRGAPLPDPATPAPPRFLPTWDATLLAHARRTQILPERYRPLLFDTRTPHSAPSFLVNGQVAGTWRYEGGRVRIDPFEPLPRSARRALDDEAERLATFHA